MTKARRRQAGEGGISAYKTADGSTRYLIKYRAPLEDGSSRVVLRRRGRDGQPFLTRKAAAEELGDILAEVRRGAHVLPKTLTVGEWLDQWLDSLRLAPSTEASYRKNVRLHLQPALGGIQMQRLTGTRITTLYRELERDGRRDHKAGTGLKPRTVRYIHTILKSALAEAVNQGLIAANPADKAKPPTVTQAKAPEMHPWNAEQLAAFLSWLWETDARHAAALHVLAYTGMRRGECLALRWSDLDLDKARLSVRRSVGVVNVGGKGKQLVEGPTKGKRARTVDLDPGTLEVLRRWRVERAALSLQLARDDALIFGDIEGRHLHPERFSARFVEKVAQCRKGRHPLPAGQAPPSIHLHDLRHTHATLLLQAGEHVKVVSERLGHATVMITWETYAHVMPGMQAEAAARFAALVGGGAQ